MGLLVNLNGTIAPTGEVSVLDRGFLYGDSVYEVIRTFQRQHFGLQEHLQRLRASAAYLYMTVPWSDQYVRSQVERTLEQAEGDEFYVRIVVSRGTETRISLQPSQDLQPSLVIIVSPISADLTLPEQGHHLKIIPRPRNDQRALAPAAKTGNYLNNILALLEAQQLGADDALMLNAQGQVTEATTSNVWIVKNGTVYTPALESGILAGITRNFMLQILREQQIPHQELLLTPEDLWSAEEALLSSSVRLLMPVRQIDDYPLPYCPGKITRLLWQELIRLMARTVA